MEKAQKKIIYIYIYIYIYIFFYISVSLPDYKESIFSIKKDLRKKKNPLKETVHELKQNGWFSWESNNLEVYSTPKHLWEINK